MAITLRPTSQAMAEPVDRPERFYGLEPGAALVADPSRRGTVRFDSDGRSLAGHVYRPPNASTDETTAGLVMCGPFSSVKEQSLPHYAQQLSDAGYTVLTFDPRGFGESEGSPRFHYDPNDVVSDYVNAVGHMLARPDVDPDRVGVVGVCMGGGYALSAAARDKRVRAVASVAGGYDIGGTFQRMLGVEGFAGYLRTINELHQRQRVTGETQYIPTIARGLTEEAPVVAMPNEEAYSYYDRTSRDHAPTWSPTMTAAGLEAYFSYNAIAHAPLIAPTPLLIVHGSTDFFLLPEYAQAAYNAALGPKSLTWIETHNHIELYDQDPYVSQAVAALLDWLADPLPAGPS